jgi:hypothetical protein
MPNYDAVRFDPPAPVAQVVIRNPERGNTVSGVSMLLDSGADVTLVPQSTASALGVLPAADQTYELMGFDGTISRASAARLEMVFLNRTFRGRFLLIDQESGIIGRDVLNSVLLLLDGPKLTWSDQSRQVKGANGGKQ